MSKVSDMTTEVVFPGGDEDRDRLKGIESITDARKEGGEVNFTGFGKFSTQKRAARQGVNPRNPGEKVTIPEATVPKFSAGSALKQAVKS